MFYGQDKTGLWPSQISSLDPLVNIYQNYDNQNTENVNGYFLLKKIIIVTG